MVPSDLLEKPLQYLRELVDVRAKLGSAQEAAESRAIAASAAESQCASLMKEIESQSEALQEHESRSADLARQMQDLREELRCKEASEQQLKEEMERLEVEMKLAIATASSQNHGEMSSALEGFLQRSSEHLSKGYMIKDEEISRLRDEIRLLSLQLKAKAQELDAQVFFPVLSGSRPTKFAQIDMLPRIDRASSFMGIIVPDLLIEFLDCFVCLPLIRLRSERAAPRRRAGSEEEDSEIGVLVARSPGADSEAPEGIHRQAASLSVSFQIHEIKTVSFSDVHVLHMMCIQICLKELLFHRLYICF
jgi:hypothetical protein